MGIRLRASQVAAAPGIPAEVGACDRPAMVGSVGVAALVAISLGFEPVQAHSGDEQGAALFEAYAKAGMELMQTVGNFAQQGKSWMLADEGFTDEQLQHFLTARQAFFEAEQESLRAVLAYKRYVDSAATASERRQRVEEWERLECEWGQKLAEGQLEPREAN